MLLKSKSLLTLLVFVISQIWISFLFAEEKAKNTYQTDPIIAKVGSETLRVSDIEDKQINDLRKQLFDVLNIQLKKAAIEKLRKKHKEYAEKPEFNVKDAEIRSMYQINGLSARGTYEQFYPMLKQYILQKKEMDHIEKLYSKATSKGLIENYLESPNEFLVKVPIETAYLWGSQKAKVMVLEFSDYQCPFCARVQPTISMLRKRYENRVIFGYRHFPLSFHREADEAAIAAECARDQDKFSEYHQLLFNNPQRLSIDDLKSYAKQLSIKNLEKFEDCLVKEKYRPRLDNDLKVGAEVGFRGTPGFVIGFYDAKKRIISGEMFSGAQPQNVFIDAIEKYVQKAY